MKKKSTIAFELLVQEFQSINNDECNGIKGGTVYDPNGNLVAIKVLCKLK